MSKNKVNVPEARAALDKVKMQAASEVGVNLKEGYNGDLTSKQAGSVGGQMVNIKLPIRTVKYDRISRISDGHLLGVEYTYSLIP
jgi:small acid-soluble spore protein D (minor alpha/beta-type SASP)